MSPITPIDVVDTAVKVGLGALISSWATLALARGTHARDLSKYQFERRAELLEKVADQIETFTHVALKYWALIVEWSRYAAPAEEMREQRREELDQTTEELFHAYKDLSRAEGQLLLLGLREAQQELREYGEYVGQFRRRFHRGNKTMIEPELKNEREQILAHRTAVFDKLSTSYARLDY